MPVRLRGVSFAYAHQSALISSADLDIGPGWTALVAPNGMGKTTLLQLIAGRLEPTSGSIDRGRTAIAYCPQIPDGGPAAEFALSWSRESTRWLSRLGLEAEWVLRWDSLSPGERRRFQIAAALGSEADLLLVDEPTNHLDESGRSLLINVLAAHRGGGLIVSHDRQLLDSLCDRVVRLHRQRLSVYPGNYSEARALWEAEDAAALRELSAAQDDVRSLRRALHAVSERHRAADRSRSTRSRMTSVHDSDARSVARKGRAEAAEAALGQATRVAAADLRRAESGIRELDRPAAAGGGVQIGGGIAPAMWLFYGTLAAVSIGGRRLAGATDVHLGRSDRIWLRGPNGCGKSTWLRELLQALSLPADRLLVLPQVPPDHAALRRAYRALSASDRTAVMTVAARLGLGASAWTVARPMSPGERRKATFAMGMVREPWLVVLDEPTNDLDVDGIERMEQALHTFDGALLVVSHDRRFGSALDLEPIDVPWVDAR